MDSEVEQIGDPLAAEAPGALPVVDTSPELSVAALFADIARELHRDDDPDATLQRIVDLAVSSVPGAEHAAITTLSGLEFTTVVATDELPMRVDQVQYETREGPCVDSLRSHEVYRANDLATDTRFLLFAPQAVSRTGVRSMLSFRLFTDEGSLGALNLYSTVPNAFTSASVAMGALFAAHASVAMNHAATADDLREAISESTEMSIAVGIVMASMGCGPDEARAVICDAAKDRRQNVTRVAAKVVETGEPPAPTTVTSTENEPGSGAGATSDPGTTAGWPRSDARALVGGLIGVVVALVLITVFGSSPNARPIALLLLPVLAVALVASTRTTVIVTVVAVALGTILVASGDSASADLRLRFLALVVGVGFAIGFAVVRRRREDELREQAAARALTSVRAETESILGAMLSRLHELDEAADVEGVAHRACAMGRDIFGADHVSYWQVDGDDCLLLSRDSDGDLATGTRIPRELFTVGTQNGQRARTRWVRATDVTVPSEGRQVATAAHAEVGTSTPVQVAGQTVAYLGMSWAHDRLEPDRSWLDAVDRFADQIALSKTVIRRRLAQRETLALAQRFQAGMLPRLAEHDLMNVQSLYRPGLHQMLLGGDFLDVVAGVDGTVSFVLGDVAGHGPEQAALGATLRGAWLSVASIPALGPADWAGALNRVVRERAPEEVMFVTALMGRLDPEARTLDYVSAGHPPPILMLPKTLAAPLGDTVLGVEASPTFTVHRLNLPEPWAVLLLTDGLFEGQLPGQQSRHGDYDGFLGYLRRTTSDDLERPSWLTDLADVLETANGGPLSDDAAALLLSQRRMT